MTDERGIDISHWNRWDNPQAAKDQQIKHVTIKRSQGKAYRDPAAEKHYHDAGYIGAARSFYHFVTNDPADEQYQNFINGIKEIGGIDYDPWMDCEPFVSYQGFDYSLREFFRFAKENRIKVSQLYGSNIGAVPYLMIGEQIYSLNYPRLEIIDVIGRKLLNHFERVAIYTNPATAKQIFAGNSVIAKRYDLVIAHWGVEKPTTPNPWKGVKNYLIWQYGVYPGEKYGFAGSLDLDIWGSAMPFPGTEEPPPAPGISIIHTLQGNRWRSYKEEIG